MSGVFIFYQEYSNLFQSKYILAILLYQWNLFGFAHISVIPCVFAQNFLSSPTSYSSLFSENTTHFSIVAGYFSTKGYRNIS